MPNLTEVNQSPAMSETPLNPNQLNFANYRRRLDHVQKLEREWQRCRAGLDCLLEERLSHIKKQQNYPSDPPSETLFNILSLKNADWTKNWWPRQIVRGSDTDEERKEEDKIIDDAWNAFLKAKLK